MFVCAYRASSRFAAFYRRNQGEFSTLVIKSILSHFFLFFFLVVKIICNIYKKMNQNTDDQSNARTIVTVDVPSSAESTCANRVTAPVAAHSNVLVSLPSRGENIITTATAEVLTPVESNSHYRVTAPEAHSDVRDNTPLRSENTITMSTDVTNMTGCSSQNAPTLPSNVIINNLSGSKHVVDSSLIEQNESNEVSDTTTTTTITRLSAYDSSVLECDAEADADLLSSTASSTFFLDNKAIYNTFPSWFLKGDLSFGLNIGPNIILILRKLRYSCIIQQTAYICNPQKHAGTPKRRATIVLLRRLLILIEECINTLPNIMEGDNYPLAIQWKGLIIDPEESYQLKTPEAMMRRFEIIINLVQLDLNKYWPIPLPGCLSPEMGAWFSAHCQTNKYLCWNDVKAAITTRYDSYTQAVRHAAMKKILSLRMRKNEGGLEFNSRFITLHYDSGIKDEVLLIHIYEKALLPHLHRELCKSRDIVRRVVGNEEPWSLERLQRTTKDLYYLLHPDGVKKSRKRSRSDELFCENHPNSRPTHTTENCSITKRRRYRL